MAVDYFLLMDNDFCKNTPQMSLSSVNQMWLFDIELCDFCKTKQHETRTILNC